MKGSLASVAVVAAIGLSVAACSSGGSGKASTGGGGGGGGSTASGSTIKVALPVPTTSGNSVAAGEMVNAAKLAVTDINKSGGAGGHPLELKIYDDQGTAASTTQVVQRALTVDDAKVIVGAYSTAESIAVRTIAERQQVVYVGASAVGPQVTQGAKFTFRATINQTDYAPPMARAIKNLGKSSPAILADTGPVGSTLPPVVVAALKSQGITAKTPVSYTLNSTDVSSSVAKVVGQHPDSVIIISSSSADQGLLVKTLNEQGLDVPIVGFGSLTAGNALKIGGAAYSKMPQVLSLQNTAPGKPEYDTFLKEYASTYGGDATTLGTTLNEQAAQTYDALMAVKLGLDATKGDASGTTLAAAMHTISYPKPVAGKEGAPISFKSSQDGFHDSLAIFKLGQNGELAPDPDANKA